MDRAEASTSGEAEAQGPAFKPSNTPEVEMLCFMLLLMNLMDMKKAQQAGQRMASACPARQHHAHGVACCSGTMR